MNKLKIGLIILLLATPVTKGDEKKSFTSCNITKNIATFAIIVTGGWLTTKAILKMYELGMKEYLLRNSLEDLSIRAKNHIESIEKAVGTEIKLEHNTDLLNLLRSKYTGELFPLYYANQLIIKMKNDITLDKVLLVTKTHRDAKESTFIETQQLIADLNMLEESLNNIQEFLSCSYEYKTEKSELNNLQYAIANHHSISHTNCCGY